MQVDYAAIAPEVTITVAICFVLLLDLGFKGRARVVSAVLSLWAIGWALFYVLRLIGTTPRVTLAGMFVVDGFALAFKGFFLVVAGLTVLLSIDYMRGHRYEGEYYFLVLSAVLGTMLMPSSRDLLMLFIALEMVSVPAFLLAGFRKQDPRSNEASLKFFIFGVLSASLFAYGISLLYGFTRTTNLGGIARALSAGTPEPLAVMAVVFVVAAFGFKISAVPFHFWAPDTYEGSPTPLAAYLSVASKAAGFAGLTLVLVLGVAPIVDEWGPIVAVLSALTMTVGNVVALRQRHLVRLLAYSSIAQAGYMLIPLALVAARPGDPQNAVIVRSILMYLLVYAVMNLGAFGVAIGLAKNSPTLLIRDLSGWGRRAPFQALALSGFLLSLGGIPPFAGWAAKFFVFMAAVNGGSKTGVILAAIMVVNSVVSLYYYVNVVRTMYLQEPQEETAIRFPALLGATIGACLAGTLLFGVYPELLIRIAGAGRLLVP